MWFETVIKDKKTAHTTAQRLKTLYRHIDPNMLVRDVGSREVQEAIMTRRLEPIRVSPKKGPPRLPKNATVNRDLIDSTLRPILNFAASIDEPVRTIIWAKLKLKEPPGRVRSFSEDELSAWQLELPEWHRALHDFVSRYGVRLSEAFFPPAAVKPETLEIVLYDTKNGHDHTLPVHQDDMPDLAQRARKAKLAKLDTIWFREMKDGSLRPIKWRGFEAASGKARKRAGVTNAKPVHDLRHHAATTLYRATGNIKLVQDLLNHKSITSSARYAHTNKDDLRRGMQKARVTKSPTNDATEAKNPVESEGQDGF